MQKDIWKKIAAAPFVTIALVTFNAIIFLICIATGNLLYATGSFGLLNLLNGEYYRLFTAMFLHADIQHLVNNMLLLGGLGAMYEKEFGHIRFGIVYFLSGLGGGLLSAYVQYLERVPSTSIGASGAVFGMVGVLLALVLFSGIKMPNVTVPRILFMICFSLYNGFQTSNIDNEAHIGGLLTGFLAATLMCPVIRYRRNKKQQSKQER